MRLKELIGGGVLALMCCLSTANAATVIAVDRDDDSPNPVITQTGFLSMPGSSVSNGTVSVSLTGGSGFEGERDRGALPGPHPLSDLLRDFSHSTGTSNVNMTVTIDGLDALTDYLVTLWGIDHSDPTNPGRGTAWYEGTSNAGSFIVGFANSQDPSLQPVFSDVFTSNALGELFFYGEGDVTYQTLPSNNTATVVIFNGLQVDTTNDVIPEPSTMAIWSLLGALGLTVGWYRRRRAA